VFLVSEPLAGWLQVRVSDQRTRRDWAACIQDLVAVHYSAAERIVIAPDCGMKYLPRDVAFGKMQAMVRGADIVRREQAN